MQLQDGVLQPAQAWLKTSLAPDDRSVSTMAVDGTLWLSTSKNAVLNFASGTPKTFRVTQADQALPAVLDLATNTSVPYIVALDKTNAHITLIQKTGEFMKSIKHDAFASASQVALDASGKQAYVLSGTFVFQVGLE
jgi:hypothetical protein